MKINYACLLVGLFAIASAHADFLDNENNHKIESCRAGVQNFLKNAPFQNATINGTNAGKSCYLRYFNIVENQHGKPVQGGFTLLTYISGNPYFSSMEVGKDRDNSASGIRSIMNSCSVGAQAVQIKTEYIEPGHPTRQEYAVLSKNSQGQLVSVRVKTPLGDQTCNFAE
ncbi:MAG: hypothetical protein ACXVBL_11110 [Bdellovibrionota bacterium]